MNLQDIKEYRDKVRSAQFEAGAKMFIDRIFSNLEEKLFNRFPDSIFYKFNNEIIAKYDKENNSFYYHYYKIYEVLSSEFGLNEIKINELIVGKVEEHLKIRGVTPKECYLSYELRWKSI